MARAAFLLKLRPDRVDAYLDAPERVWPEMLDEIRAAGIRNYTLFLNGASVFGYLESDDLDSSWAYLAASDVNARWQAAMADYLEERVASGGPATLPEIFRLD